MRAKGGGPAGERGAAERWRRGVGMPLARHQGERGGRGPENRNEAKVDGEGWKATVWGKLPRVTLLTEQMGTLRLGQKQKVE